MNLQLKIKKKSQPEWLVWLLVFMPFMFGTLFDFLPLPSVLKYALDAAWVILLALFIFNLYYKRIHLDTNFKLLIGWIIAFLAFTFLVYLFNYQSVFYYLMGIRNNFRFYVSFIAFITFLSDEDVQNYMRIFDYLFWINAAIMLFQYIFLDYKQDSLGGIFGTQAGCNGYVNIFFVVYFAKIIIGYLNKSEKTSLMVLKSATLLLLATFAEIKYFYVEFIVIVFVSLLVTSFSWRKLLVIVGSAVAVVVFVNLLILIFPYFADLVSIEAILKDQSEGYSSADAIGRLNAVSTMSRVFLDTIPQKLTGLGLGNCDTSTVDLFNTPFYQEYGYLRYFWFSTAHLTLETGYLGLMFFVGFFVMVAVLSAISLKKGSENKTYWQLSLVVAICSILIFIYNSSLRTEAAYIIYFVLSLPFALQKYVIGENR